MSANPHILPAPAQRYHWRRRWFGTSGYWAGQGVFWGLLAAFLISNGLADPNAKESPAEVWKSNCIVVLAGCGLTHLVRILVLALRGRVRSWLVLIGVLVPLSIAAGTALLSLLLILALLFDPAALLEGGTPLTLADFAGSIGFFSALFAIWTGFYLGYCYYRGYREGVIEHLRLQTVVKEAELRTLKAQVNPHFLFNSLNTLRSMLPPELVRPREAVTLLAELLRATLTLGDRTTVAMSEELETVENYIALEQLRFEERLRVRARVDDAARALQVPPFVLQTLIENAVKFGVGSRREGGEVSYEVMVLGGVLLLRVTNPGRLGCSSESTGLGLANVRARLLHLYGPAAALTLDQAAPDLVVAEVRIPAARSAPSISNP